MQTITITEMQIIAVWHFTNTAAGCSAAILTFKKLIDRKSRNEDEEKLLYDAKNLAFAKGNLLMLEAREAYVG